MDGNGDLTSRKRGLNRIEPSTMGNFAACRLPFTSRKESRNEANNDETTPKIPNKKNKRGKNPDL
jgi:hypothetical protein